MSLSFDVNLWPSAEHALEYLRRADTIPHRVEGEATLLEFVPANAARILDLGSGGGRLLGLVRAARPQAQFVALDFSPTMLDTLRERFSSTTYVTVIAHDLTNPLPEMGASIASFPASLSTIYRTSASGACMARYSNSLLPMEFSATSSM